MNQKTKNRWSLCELSCLDLLECAKEVAHLKNELATQSDDKELTDLFAEQGALCAFALRCDGKSVFRDGKEALTKLSVEAVGRLYKDYCKRFVSVAEESGINEHWEEEVNAIT